MLYRSVSAIFLCSLVGCSGFESAYYEDCIANGGAEKRCRCKAEKLDSALKRKQKEAFVNDINGKDYDFGSRLSVFTVEAIVIFACE